MSAIAVHPRIVPTAGGRSAPARRSAQVREVGRTAASARPGARTHEGDPERRAAVAVPARLHLTRRGRLVLVLLALLVVVAGVMGGRAVADGPVQAREVTTHAVMSGETLWQIAAGVAAPGEDVRDVVLMLQELNDLPDASLRAGQVLLLPAG